MAIISASTASKPTISSSSTPTSKSPPGFIEPLDRSPRERIPKSESASQTTRPRPPRPFRICRRRRRLDRPARPPLHPRPRPHHHRKDTGQYDTTEEVFWATGACMCFSSKLFRQTGGFYEFYFMHQEDIDLCWRVRNMGYSIYACPELRRLPQRRRHPFLGELPENFPDLSQ